MINFLEAIGAVAGLLGAFLLATHTNVSRYGWIAFLLANLALIGFAIGIERYWLLAQQVGFTATSLLGLSRSGLLPFSRKRWKAVSITKRKRNFSEPSHTGRL